MGYALRAVRHAVDRVPAWIALGLSAVWCVLLGIWAANVVLFLLNPDIVW